MISSTSRQREIIIFVGWEGENYFKCIGTDGRWRALSLQFHNIPVLNVDIPEKISVGKVKKLKINDSDDEEHKYHAFKGSIEKILSLKIEAQFLVRCDFNFLDPWGKVKVQQLLGFQYEEVPLTLPQNFGGERYRLSIRSENHKLTARLEELKTG